MDDQKLKQYLEFDETDLQANRAGQLTEKQKARFAQDDGYTKKWSLIGGLIVLALTALGPLGILKTWLSHADMTFALIFGGIWTVIWGLSRCVCFCGHYQKWNMRPPKYREVRGWWNQTI